MFSKLRERKMVQWAVAYGAGALVLLEIADFLADAFDWPTVTLRVITVVVAFALLAVLVIAWYHGEKGHQRVRAVEMLLLALIASAGAGTVWWVGTRAVAEETAGAGSDPADTLITAVDRPADGRTGVAVLPFVNITGDGAHASFADGMTEDLIAELAREPGLRVISRTSVMQYKDTDKNIPLIGRELGVDAVLEGSIQVAGDQVRITAQLIDARTDEHLWAQTYDRSISDILRVQSEVARDISENLRESLGADVELVARTERPEVDPAAVEFMMQGRELASSDAPADRARAAALFEQAVARDSNLVSAVAELAEISLPADMDPMDAPAAGPVPDPKVRALVRRAMERMPDLPAFQTFEIRSALEDNDLAQAEAAARRAVEANPNNVSAQRYLALLLGRHGRFDQALQHLEAAQALDPHSHTLGTDIGEMLYAAGRHDAAIAQLEGVLQKHPRHVPARIGLGLAYQAKGNHERAIEELHRAAEQSHQNPLVLGTLGWVLAAQGEVAEARSLVDSLRNSPALHGAGSVAIAQILMGLGEVEEAARWLQGEASGRAAAEAPRIQWLRLDPRFRRVFADSIVDSLIVRKPRPPRGR